MVIGHIGLSEATKLPVIEYQQHWKENSFPITPSLSLQGPNTPASVYNYLDNLLPEGKARELLAQNLGVSEKNVFAQALALGQDVSGAFAFNSQDTPNRPVFREIPSEELIRRLEKKEDFGLLHWDDKPRLSVAGVQDKLNIYISPDGQMGFGDGTLPSTHILKFEKANLPHLVLNEFICMQLAKLSGLPTAETQFIRFEQFPAQVLQVINTQNLSEELEQQQLISTEEKNYIAQLIEHTQTRTQQLQASADDIADISL